VLVGSITLRLGVVVIMLYFGLRLADKIGTEANNAAERVTGWAGRSLGMVTYGALGYGVRNTIGAAGARRLAPSIQQKASSSTGVAGALWRGTNWANKSVAQSSFDARRTQGGKGLRGLALKSSAGRFDIGTGPKNNKGWVKNPSPTVGQTLKGPKFDQKKLDRIDQDAKKAAAKAAVAAGKGAAGGGTAGVAAGARPGTGTPGTAAGTSTAPTRPGNATVLMSGATIGALSGATSTGPLKNAFGTVKTDANGWPVGTETWAATQNTPQAPTTPIPSSGLAELRDLRAARAERGEQPVGSTPQASQQSSTTPRTSAPGVLPGDLTTLRELRADRAAREELPAPSYSTKVPDSPFGSKGQLESAPATVKEGATPSPVSATPENTPNEAALSTPKNEIDNGNVVSIDGTKGPGAMTQDNEPQETHTPPPPTPPAGPAAAHKVSGQEDITIAGSSIPAVSSGKIAAAAQGPQRVVPTPRANAEDRPPTSNPQAPQPEQTAQQKEESIFEKNKRIAEGEIKQEEQKRTLARYFRRQREQGEKQNERVAQKIEEIGNEKTTGDSEEVMKSTKELQEMVGQNPPPPSKPPEGPNLAEAAD
jgi:hypothetical protein